MSNGELWTAIITCKGSLLNVSVADPSKGVSFAAISNYAIDISALLGTTTAYAGFTASTGAGLENHDIVNWRPENTANLTDTPEPASWMLAALGVVVLAILSKRLVTT